jgi:RNA polymerase sigma-70 factor (ECF subfamily)
MSAPLPEEARRLADAGSRRGEVLAELLEQQRGRLMRMVELRIDGRVRARMAPSDVIQEAWLEAGQRIDEWLRDPSMPFNLWVRFLAAQRLAQAHRFHLGAQRRSAGRERPLDAGSGPAVLVGTMAGMLADHHTSPTEGAARQDLREGLERALESLEDTDREVLALRHFEGLSNAEVALALGIEPKAASKRYLRALERLRSVYDPGTSST